MILLFSETKREKRQRCTREGNLKGKREKQMSHYFNLLFFFAWLEFGGLEGSNTNKKENANNKKKTKRKKKKTQIKTQNVNKASSPGSSQCWEWPGPGNEVDIAADVNMIAVSTCPAAGHGFQNTKVPGSLKFVSNSSEISQWFLQRP